MQLHIFKTDISQHYSKKSVLNSELRCHHLKKKMHLALIFACETINSSQINNQKTKSKTHTLFTYIMRNLLFIEMHWFTIMVNL